MAPGSTLVVQFKETVEHTGHYRIAFSPSGDTGFDANILLNNIADKVSPANYTSTVTMPNTPCTGCTIQLIQVMIDDHPEAPTYYYSCADIELVVGLPDAGPGVMPGPTPTPGPSPDPKMDNGPDAPDPPGAFCTISVGSHGGGSAALVLGAMLIWGGLRHRRRR